MGYKKFGMCNAKKKKKNQEDEEAKDK